MSNFIQPYVTLHRLVSECVGMCRNILNFKPGLETMKSKKTLTSPSRLLSRGSTAVELIPFPNENLYIQNLGQRNIAILLPRPHWGRGPGCIAVELRRSYSKHCSFDPSLKMMGSKERSSAAARGAWRLGKR